MKKILFVDSYPPLLALYKEEFTDEGYEVFMAMSGKEALRKYRKAAPDLVIMDLHLPDMDGIELMNSLLAIYSHALIIINDTHLHTEDFRTWMAEGHLLKSNDLTQLKEKAREVLLLSRIKPHKSHLGQTSIQDKFH